LVLLVEKMGQYQQDGRAHCLYGDRGPMNNRLHSVSVLLLPSQQYRKSLLENSFPIGNSVVPVLMQLEHMLGGLLHPTQNIYTRKRNLLSILMATQRQSDREIIALTSS
jgi:hypothetical protein